MSKEKEFVPYGKHWEATMAKMTKNELIAFIKKTLIKYVVKK